MSPTPPAAYLQDVDAPPFQATKRKAAELASTSEALAKKGRPKATIETFFFSSPGLSQPAQKKLRTPTGSIILTPASPKIPKLNSIPFSLSAFRNSLNVEVQELLQLECESMSLSWLKLLKDEIQKAYFLDLKRFLWAAGLKYTHNTPSNINIYPPAKEVYSWSKTPLGKVKVVIIGQDPYHWAGQAHGLCFSVPIGVKVPPSLLNIFKELKAEYPEFITPRHGNLVAWASNGVLMLNTCLTVMANQPGSHSRKGWETFTEKVISVVDQYGGANLPSGPNRSEPTGVGRGIVFLAWGAWAAERVSNLSKSKHLVLTSAHPSPRSADRGFFGNGHFLKANSWLEEKYGPENKVDWCSLTYPAPTV